MGCGTWRRRGRDTWNTWARTEENKTHRAPVACGERNRRRVGVEQYLDDIVCAVGDRVVERAEPLLEAVVTPRVGSVIKEELQTRIQPEDKVRRGKSGARHVGEMGGWAKHGWVGEHK